MLELHLLSGKSGCTISTAPVLEASSITPVLECQAGRARKSPFPLLWIQYSCFSLYPPLYSKRPNIQGDRTNATKVLSDPQKSQRLFQLWLQRKHDSLDPFLLLRMPQSLADPTVEFPNPGNFKCLDFNSGIGVQTSQNCQDWKTLSYRIFLPLDTLSLLKAATLWTKCYAKDH